VDNYSKWLFSLKDKHLAHHSSQAPEEIYIADGPIIQVNEQRSKGQTVKMCVFSIYLLF